ncbi:MAG: GNAT family N-acetyltransferase [Pseudomonadota bacterium]
MSNVAIVYNDSDTKGHYVGSVNGNFEVAELTTSKVSPSLVIADHTFVPESMRGQGMARALAERLIADARSAGQRIVPLCPFVRSFAERNKKELDDVIQW